MGSTTTNIALYKPTDSTETGWGASVNTNFDSLDTLAGAKFILQTSNAKAPNAQLLGSLATGLVKNTTTTGVLSIATAGTDYYNPGGTDVAVADGGTGLSSWTQNAIIYASAATTLAGITPAASSVLVTNGSNAPSLSTDLPTAVTIGAAYIYRAGGTDVPLLDGGTNASLVASNGGIIYSTATAMAVLSGTATAGQMLRSGASAAPTWSTATFPATATGTGTILRADGTNWVATTATYPNTTTINRILYSSSNDVIGQITTGNSGLLVTDSGGIPSISTDIPTAVTIGGAAIYRVGGTDVSMADGGTGASLVDPNADRMLFWDDSAGAVTFLAPGTGLTITTTTIACDAATTTNSGIAEASIASEVDTGTDAARYVSPDSLAGSNLGEKIVQMVVFDFTTNTATGDGKFYFVIPSSLNGMNLVEVHARVITAGTTNTTDIQIANVTDAVDILSTKLTIDSAETGSETAASAAVINAANDDVATNDLLRIDVDAVSTTPAKGLIVTCIFRLP